MRRRLLVGSFAGVLALAQVLGTNLTAHAAAKSHNQLVAVNRVGSINLRAAAAAAKGTSAGTELSPAAYDPGKPSPNKHLQHTYAAGQPSVSPTAVSDASSGFGFNGVNHMMQRYAGAGDSTWQNTQFSLIPSDQGLCVSSGLSTNYVVEPVNDAVRVYDASTGAPTSGYILPLNEFFHQPPEFNRTTGVYGTASIGDPECYFDVQDQRWFATVYDFSVDPSTGDFIAPTYFLVNVSDGSDPNGAWTTYSVNATDPTAAGSPNCPCFPDHPNLGADANGIYVTTDDYGINSSYFGGAQLYAFSKSGLEAGTITSAAHIDMKQNSDWTFSLPPFMAWPAQSPGASDWDTTNAGTEYVGSAMDIIGAVPIHSVNASSFGVWALTNTTSLGSTPNLTLHFVNTPTELYSQPPNAIQRNGPYPLGQGDYAIYGAKAHGAEELVESDQDFTSQTYYAHGTLWNAVNTAVKEPNGATVAGIAWLAFNPTANGTSVSAPLTQQGYLAPPEGDYLQYPSIASTSDGSKTVMVFDLVGPDYYPSVAYTTLSTSSSGNSGIKVATWGTAPLDTFGGYQVYKYQPGLSRQGDYTAAVADSSGNIWLAGQWVQGNNLCVHSSLVGCASDNRSLLANWATWIAER